MKEFQNKITLYMDAGFPIVYLETFEEEKAESIIREIAGNADDAYSREIVEWNIHGLFFPREKKRVSNIGLSEVLENFSGTKAGSEELHRRYNLEKRILLLKDTSSFIEQPEVYEKLKHLAEKIWRGDIEECTIVIISPNLHVPKGIEHFVAIFSLDALLTKDIEKIITDFCEEQNVRITSPEFLNRLTVAFKGLPEFEIKTILSLIVADDRNITLADLSIIHEQKKQMIQKSGILEMIQVKETVADIGGLENLKAWLRRKAAILKEIDRAEAFGVDTPKGVLIAGLPGCGKSLSAKAAAALFEMPLLRLDMGRLMGKYVGESEANLRKATALIDAISPCVLWIDELEKAFSGIGEQGGSGEVTTRLFGAFLTWMQEKKSLSFVVATANNIAKLPPELLRKGRFDEIFYVSLPKEKERAKILEIHIKKRRPADFSSIQLPILVEKTKGYCGADIEGAVKEAVEKTFAEGKSSLTTETLVSCIEKTHPLSEIMKDEIKKMSEDYEKRRFQKAS